MASLGDLPTEILKEIFKKLDPSSVKNCSITCVRWMEIVAHYIFQPYLQKFAEDENLSLSIKKKLRKKGWTHECIDYGLIIALYEEYKFFKARILVTTGVYDQSYNRIRNKVTEVIDLFDHKKSFGFGDKSDIIRVGATGGLLHGKPIICGGAKYNTLSGGKYGTLQDMYSADSSLYDSEYMIHQRAYSASVILNINQFTTNLWVTGGNDRCEVGQKTTEFVIIRDALTEKTFQPVQQLDSIEGPDLPFTICQHGIVKIKENAIYIIGGRQNGNISSDVWIVDPTNNYSVTQGPSLKTSRYEFSCGTMEVDGRTMIVVAGGYTKPKTFLDTVEILDPLLSEEGGGKPNISWSFGPKLPYRMVGTSMVTAPGGKGVIVIGGLVNYYDEKEDNLSKMKSNQLWVLKAKAKEWVMLKQTLQNARYWSVAIPLYDEWGHSLPGIDQKFVERNDSTGPPPKKKTRK